ncbi:Uma2 family endonuclease [Nocardia tenerifensis]|uniref:Uma2 family endonuclease n=1 Tax=Nocardia tenerifensis TaxID=228006 RepID=A0A318KIV4_9NOCA|nr:Uma2 family endonuclease [Nocardia tenerifensis]PXX68347.1 Uma2 family endonuclease [Nocardia tenerifensis]
MTALPEPGQLLTIADYVALGEDDRYRLELEEGKLLMVPSPEPEHNLVALGLCYQLRAQLPRELVAVPDVDVDLQLTPEGGPATVRRPDVIIVRRDEIERRKAEGGILRASGVLVVVEIVSPGTRRTDYRIKRGDYEDAGIEQYWILDPNPPVSMLALRLTDELGYVDNGEASATFTTNSPCSLTISLNQLD